MELKILTVLLMAVVGCVAVLPQSIGQLRTGLLVRISLKLQRPLPANLEQLQEAPSDSDVDPTTLYPAYNFTVPIDHFQDESRYEPHSNGTYDMRYWFDATFYKAGGPVLVLASGETSGDDRLPYLQKGETLLAE